MNSRTTDRTDKAKARGRAWYDIIKETDLERYAKLRASQNLVSRKFYEAHKEDPAFRAANAERMRNYRARLNLIKKEMIGTFSRPQDVQPPNSDDTVNSTHLIPSTKTPSI
jgi:hypothetical protein